MTVARIQFVLVEPLYAGNIGAACRAIKNNGFKALRLVNPPPLDDLEAKKMAWKSFDVLQAARRFDTLETAIADCTLVVGFSARPRRPDRPFLELDEALPRIAAAIGGSKASRAPARTGRAKPVRSKVNNAGRVALLFGREDRGLTRDELAACQFLIRIDAVKERAVYNLAQAVLLVAYRLRRELDAKAPARARASTALPAFAPTEMSDLPAAARSHLRERIRGALLALGYGELADSALLGRIVARSDRLLDRARLDESDLAMLLGIIRRIDGSGASARPRRR